MFAGSYWFIKIMLTYSDCSNSYLAILTLLYTKCIQLIIQELWVVVIDISNGDGKGGCGTLKMYMNCICFRYSLLQILQQNVNK